MNGDPLHISMDTLIGVAPMLGYPLEDRRRIREQQDAELVDWLQMRTSTRLRDPSQQDLFCIAPFDVLVTEAGGRKQFHVIEINGTGIGGFSNMADSAILAVMNDLSEMAQRLAPSDAVVLVACSGKEDERAPRCNRLLHEKVLYAEALRRGFAASGRPAHVTTLTQFQNEARSHSIEQPVVVLGYMKEFLKFLRADDEGKLSLFERQVHAAVNDRFCLNLLHRFDQQIDLEAFQTMNRCFLAGGDKGITYALLNDYFDTYPQQGMPTPIRFERVWDRDALIAAVHSELRHGRKTVVKPQGTGHGDGIEFFVSAAEDAQSIVSRLDKSIRLTEDLYGLPGGAFPYTVCEFVDSLSIQREQHPLFGHKYELRVAVYRDGMKLNAFPSIIKISSEKYDKEAPTYLSLINNITASSHAKNKAGVEFMLPLANRRTWELLGLATEDVVSLCAALTGFTRYLLDQVQDQPEFFGLPPQRRESHRKDSRHTTHAVASRV